ncbi:hypothetical protein ACFLQ7_01805 [Actinomycetota bacterium]
MRDWIERYRIEILLALLVVVIAGPVVHQYRAQQASRYVFTAAIWDDRSIVLDAYADADPPVLGIDRAVRDGRTYSDKAPLQPVLAVPVYAAYRAVGGSPAIEARYDEHLGLWWVTLWMSTLPAALLAVAMYRFARAFRAEASLQATVALFFGSMLLPFSMLLFGHILCALFVFGSFALLAGERRSTVRLLAAGVLAGLAVASEYTASIGILILAAYAVWREHRRAGWFMAGGIPAAVGLAWYHLVAFGSPFAHPYRYSAFDEVTEEARGFFEIFSSVHLDHLIALIVSGRGFLFASPVVIIGLIGLVMMARANQGEHQSVAIVSLLMFVSYLMIPVFWENPWGGDSPGPRYMVPAIPFLATGVAFAWYRLGMWAKAAAIYSIIVMGVASFTDPLLSDEAAVGLGSWLKLASDGDIVPTIFTIALGPVGWLIHFSLVAGVGWALYRASRERDPERQVALT